MGPGGGTTRGNDTHVEMEACKMWLGKIYQHFLFCQRPSWTIINNYMRSLAFSWFADILELLEAFWQVLRNDEERFFSHSSGHFASSKTCLIFQAWMGCKKMRFFSLPQPERKERKLTQLLPHNQFPGNLSWPPVQALKIAFFYCAPNTHHVKTNDMEAESQRELRNSWVISLQCQEPAIQW